MATKKHRRHHSGGTRRPFAKSTNDGRKETPLQVARQLERYGDHTRGTRARSWAWTDGQRAA